MQNLGLFISTWEYDLIRTKKFWLELGKIVETKKITIIGFPPLSPYGISYRSQVLKEHIHIEDFTELFLDGLRNIIGQSPEVNVYLWHSILYNTFLPVGHHQINFKGETNSDLVCPNKPEVRQEVKRILKDSFDQEWFDVLNNLEPDFRILLDGIRFYSIDYCGCDECVNKFKETFSIDDLSFHRFKKDLAIEPLIFQKWVNFRSKSLAEFLADIVSSTRVSPNRFCAVYDGFADESSLITGTIKHGCLLHDFLGTNIGQIAIKGSNKWLFNRSATDELRFMIPLWRDMIINKEKDLALGFYGHLLPDQIITIEQLSRQTGVNKVFFHPLSNIGVREIFRHYLSK